MVTNPDEPIKEPNHSVEAAERLTRTLLAGSEVGAVRRIILYLIVAVTLGALSGGGTWGIILGGVGLIALLLLAMTDKLA